MDLVHLDVKPENIFISHPETVVTPPLLCDSIPENGDVPLSHQDGRNDVVVYKIGDMGHVVSIVERPTEEGDCRYMAPELLQDEVCVCVCVCVCTCVCVCILHDCLFSRHCIFNL